MYLHEDKQTFNAAVARTANELKLLPAVVAKDYFVYAMLKEVSSRYPDIVFKGGTSLSKCYRIIQRFSEDIDLGVEATRLTQGQHKKVKTAVVEAASSLGLIIRNLDETRSRRDFNRYVIEPPFDISVSGIGKDLIVETAFMTPVSPSVVLPAGNLIFDYYSSLDDGEALLDAFELNPFDVNVTSIERSFVDKAFALCDYYLSDRPADRCSRHIYDEFKLLELVKMDASMMELFDRVRNERYGLPFCLSADPSVSLSATLREVVRTAYYEADYRGVTRELLWEQVPYEQAVSALTAIADFLDS